MAFSSVSAPDPILVAAADLFEQHGYDRVSVDSIAERSGFARSTVFARYANKEALLVGIVRAFFQRFPTFVVSRAAMLRRNGAAAPAAASGSGERPEVPAGGDLPTDLGERIPPVLAAFLEEAGALARVALAARDLPWVRRALHQQGFDLAREFARCLGPAADDPLFVSLTVDVLKCVCLDGRDGRKCIDERKAAQLLALPHMWLPALRRNDDAK
ncbi:MAG: helix-turn-helix transcriptional regulator [Deltaproteobacteria bacterium]|nr:helix-turn-helix transcriptional regulator [Deltaproteobacteria bacterium]